MQTWLLVCLVVLVGGVLTFVMSPPEFVAKWFVAKFELHPQLTDATTDISMDGKPLEGEYKALVMEQFNRAIFIERYYGHLPTHSGTPVIIHTKQGSTDIRFFVYTYDDHVDVYKQYKKKQVAYRLIAKRLQERPLFPDSLSVHA